MRPKVGMILPNLGDVVTREKGLHRNTRRFEDSFPEVPIVRADGHAPFPEEGTTDQRCGSFSGGATVRTTATAGSLDTGAA